jgi:hydrogenase maturation protein HypF
VRITGIVQGVGFRPFVHREAVRLGLSGFVRNSSGGVELEVEGATHRLRALVREVRKNPPDGAQVFELEESRIAPSGEPGFRIVGSSTGMDLPTPITPDLATCSACLAELRDSRNRRYGYPFLNCTGCGPRFTIVEEPPYDRERTAMKRFAMCPLCAREYGEILDRRYHAEATACAVCGPEAELLDARGRCLSRDELAVREARARLAAGEIVAVKGLGGFHLACDATRDDLVCRLRRSKQRPHRPLAMMCRDLETVDAYCRLSSEEARELSGPRRPILLLARRELPLGRHAPLAPRLAPGQLDVGVMLPYTPLHHLLLEPGAPACLVMTSGNRSDEPIVTDNEVAIRDLGRIADALLVHDRPIRNRCDDSVGYLMEDRLVLLRRSRGFAPLPIELPCSVPPTLALGAQANNVFAVAEGRRVFLSQHIGDVDNLETLGFLEDATDRFSRWLGVQPRVVVHDMHPGLLTTRLARELATDCTRVAVQHHHAHLASAVTAAGITDEVQGWVLDGTGWGPDGTVWGCELLVGAAARVTRAGHLRLLPLPGGEAAIRRPLRAAVAYLHVLVPGAASVPLELWRAAEPGEVELVRRMVDRGFNTTLTSSAGRLFDAVAALLGVRVSVSYQGQAAIELEQLARKGVTGRGPRLRLDVVESGAELLLDPEPLLSGLVEALASDALKADLALEFHQALAAALSQACRRVRGHDAPGRVVLCGGVFQNRILSRLAARSLSACGLEAVLPGQIPVSDGGLAVGQVMVAEAALRGAAAGEEQEACRTVRLFQAGAAGVS